MRRFLGLTVLLAFFAGCAGDAGTTGSARDGFYTVEVKNGAGRSFEGRVGIDGVIVCTFELPRDATHVCDTGKATDGETHLFFVRASANPWDVSDRGSLSAAVVRATVSDNGITFGG